MILSLSQIPVTWFWIAFLVGVYLFNGGKWINCDNLSFRQQLIHSLIHTLVMHLLTNLFSLYQLNHLERSYGTWNYLGLIIIFLIASSSIHSLLLNWELWPFKDCSIGFSAVLLGLIVYDKLNINNWVFDIGQLQNVIIMLLIPLLRNPRTSITGHLSGILSGILVGLISGLLDL